MWLLCRYICQHVISWRYICHHVKTAKSTPVTSTRTDVAEKDGVDLVWTHTGDTEITRPTTCERDEKGDRWGKKGSIGKQVRT